MTKVVLAVHLGAGGWNIDINNKDILRNIIAQAIDEGYREGLTGSAVDIVVRAIEILEDSGIVNAGRGSTVDLSGSISMDAGIMYSGYGKAGAVAYVRYPKNPIKLARYILENTDHVILAGDAADNLALKIGLEKHLGPSETIIKKYNDAINKIKQGLFSNNVFRKSISLWKQLEFSDTVGAIAMDNSNEFAAGVSTGGIFLKMPGRVGDSAIPGAGFYANKCGAAVATGIGEFIIMTLLTFRVVTELCNSKIDNVINKSLRLITDKYGTGTAGIIAIDINGNIYGDHNTKMMPWGFIDKNRKIHIFV